MFEGSPPQRGDAGPPPHVLRAVPDTRGHAAVGGRGPGPGGERGEVTTDPGLSPGGRGASHHGGNAAVAVQGT